jgi:uncharacterized protein YjbJ (UPF0337 family)
MSINKDQVAGRAKEVSGAGKEAVGKIVGNPKLEIKGKLEKATGAVQAGVGDVVQEARDDSKEP